MTEAEIIKQLKAELYAARTTISCYASMVGEIIERDDEWSDIINYDIGVESNEWYDRYDTLGEMTRALGVNNDALREAYLEVKKNDFFIKEMEENAKIAEEYREEYEARMANTEEEEE